MVFENVIIGSLPADKVEEIIDDAAERFGKLCAECFTKAALEIARPDMDVKTLVTLAVSRAIYNQERKPLSTVKEEQAESDPGPSSAEEPSFAVYLKEEGEMDDATT